LTNSSEKLANSSERNQPKLSANTRIGGNPFLNPVDRSAWSWRVLVERNGPVPRLKNAADFSEFHRNSTDSDRTEFKIQ
jgi:hypothetical protein